MAINHGSVVADDGCDALTGEPLRRTAGGIPRFKPLPAADGLILTEALRYVEANLWVEDIIDAEPAAALEHAA